MSTGKVVFIVIVIILAIVLLYKVFIQNKETIKPGVIAYSDTCGDPNPTLVGKKINTCTKNGKFYKSICKTTEPSAVRIAGPGILPTPQPCIWSWVEISALEYKNLNNY